MKKNQFIIETWKSDQSNIEVHHFLGVSKATYVFGYNPKLISKKTYKKLLAIIKKEIKI